MTNRRNTTAVPVGAVVIGGGAPIVVQSMTNTDTADARATADQVASLARAGSELVRITVNNEDAARQVPHIRDLLAREGVDVPLVGDFHFNGHKLLTRFPECAEALAKYRINPGNVGRGSKRDSQYGAMIEVACRHDKPIRIGVNWGSLDQELLTRLMDRNSELPTPREARAIVHEAMIQSAVASADRARQLGLGADRIVLSCKMSGVQDLISVYTELAQRCDYALHLGLTEAGMGSRGIVASTAALAVLLQEDIGDTIRISLTPEPGGDRTQEVLSYVEYFEQDILARLRRHIHTFAASGTSKVAGPSHVRALASGVSRRRIARRDRAESPRPPRVDPSRSRPSSAGLWSRSYPGVLHREVLPGAG